MSNMFLIALWLFADLQTYLVRDCGAIVMSGCGANSPLEMVENSQNYNVTCINIGGTDWVVNWERDRGVGSGTCVAPNSCTSTTRPIAVVSRPTYSTTIMAVKITTRQLFANKVVTCYTETLTNPPVRKNEDSCVVDVVVPAVLSAASVEVVKTSPSWTLRANTTITTVFSSQGRYSCVWYQESQSGASVASDMSPSLSPAASNMSDLSNRTGWCSSSWTMPLTSGTYSYVVVASPGTTTQSAGSLSIERPENPSLGSGCPVDYVPELSAVTCTCISPGSPPGVIGWSHDTSSPVLTLPNVTRSDHNTNFTCDVKWSSLTLHTTLNLRVSYRTQIKAFNLNNMATHLTVNESDVTSVSLTCRSDGRPTPRMQLVRTRDGSVLKTVNGGSYTDVDDDTVVDHVISPARCEDTGTYMCVSDNQLGPEERQTLSLFVNCVPRRADFPTVHYEGCPVHLSVDMVAFPLPETFTFVFHGPGNNLSEPVTSGLLDMHCKNMLAAYIAICNITAKTMTSTDAGFYSVRIGNSVGNSTVTFEVKYFDEDPQAGESSSGGLSAGAAVGATLAVVFVVVGFVVGFVVVWIWRRHWVLPCASPANGSSNTEYNQAAVSPPVSVEPKEQQNARSNEMPDDGQQASNQYDILQLQDIGVRSDYAELSHYVNSGMKSASRTGKKQ